MSCDSVYKQLLEKAQLDSRPAGACTGGGGGGVGASGSGPTLARGALFCGGGNVLKLDFGWLAPPLSKFTKTH